MSLPAQTISDLEATDALNVDAPVLGEIDVTATTVTDVQEVVAIELNFKAFADDIPPTQHARRVAHHSDPSLQDFADQALEVAALRAELKRLNHDYEVMQQAVTVRDQRVHMLQEQLAATRAGFRTTTEQLSKAQSRLALAADAARSERPPEAAATDAPAASETLAHELTSTLVLPGSPVASPPAAEPQQAAKPEASVVPLTSRRRLVPVGHDAKPVVLSRDIMTIGRARENDICIPSNGVSRDHARLLMNARSVTIVDMGSANGCFVNDEPVKRHKLHEGDVLRIGDRSFRFVNDSASS